MYLAEQVELLYRENISIEDVLTRNKFLLSLFSSFGVREYKLRGFLDNIAKKPLDSVYDYKDKFIGIALTSEIYLNLKAEKCWILNDSPAKVEIETLTLNEVRTAMLIAKAPEEMFSALDLKYRHSTK